VYSHIVKDSFCNEKEIEISLPAKVTSNTRKSCTNLIRQDDQDKHKRYGNRVLLFSKTKELILIDCDAPSISDLQACLKRVHEVLTKGELFPDCPHHF
jgi:hypothetical protein